MTHSAPIVRRSIQNGVAVVAAVGEIDIGCADELARELEAAIGEVSPRVVVDLSETTFLDSTGIGALVQGAKSAAAAGGWLRVVAPQENVLRVLQITKMDEFLGIYPGVEQAIAG